LLWRDIEKILVEMSIITYNWICLSLWKIQSFPMKFTKPFGLSTIIKCNHLLFNFVFQNLIPVSGFTILTSVRRQNLWKDAIAKKGLGFSPKGLYLNCCLSEAQRHTCGYLYSGEMQCARHALPRPCSQGCCHLPGEYLWAVLRERALSDAVWKVCNTCKSKKNSLRTISMQICKFICVKVRDLLFICKFSESRLFWARMASAFAEEHWLLLGLTS
jgi:hypothetical protein